jgi:O-antigen biosynthesis protein
MGPGDLVTVIIPTYERAELLLTRSIPSVLAQTYPNWELLVIGDGATRSVDAAMATVTDPRIKYENRPRQNYPPEPYHAWMCRGADAINYGLDIARGTAVTTLGDDDELMPFFVETLLGLAQENEWGLVYGRSEIVGHGFLGDGNPRLAAQTNSMLWQLNEVRQDPRCYERGLPNDWLLMQDLMASGLPWGFTSTVVHRYFPSEHTPDSSPA